MTRSITAPARPQEQTRQRSLRRQAAAYLTEARYEFLKHWRLPIYTISTIAFPLMFYAIFGLLFGGQQASGVQVATYMVATYGSFGIIACALFGFGVSVAVERGQGWMRLKRASPMPAAAYFVAKLLMAILFGAILLLALFALGAAMGGVRLAPVEWLALFGTLLLGTLPFSAMGLAFGYLLGANSAPAVLNLVYLPMAFASGLWMPIGVLPPAVQQIAHYLPAYHYSQLALGTIGASQGAAPYKHAAVLIAFTLLFLVIALFAYRRDEGRTYG